MVFFNSFEWNDLLSNVNLYEIYSKILEILNQFIPKKPFISSKKPAWYNKRLSNLIKHKKNKATNDLVMTKLISP